MTSSARSGPTGRLRAPHGGPVRIVLAKLGLDGHDRGLKVVARMLRDAGAEVVYLGLRQTTEAVAAAAQQEDADLIGISMHNGGHLTLAPRMVDTARAAGVEAPVVVGGIIPAADVEALHEAGVAVVLTPGTSEADVVAAIVAAIDDRGGT
jgi:methylmalonyl-CoA mutase, C-terminal domain